MESLSSSGGGGMAASSSSISFDQSAALTFHHTDYLLHAYVRYTQPHPAAQAAAAAAQQQGGAGSAAAAAASPYAHSPPMPILIIEAEQRSNGHRWTGEFSAKCQRHTHTLTRILARAKHTRIARVAINRFSPAHCSSCSVCAALRCVPLWCSDIEEMSLKTGNFKKFSLFVRMLSSALGKTSETVFIDLLTFQDLEALKARKQGAHAHAQTQAQTQQRAQTAAVAQAQNKRYIILTYVAEFDKYAPHRAVKLMCAVCVVAALSLVRSPRPIANAATL